MKADSPGQCIGFCITGTVAYVVGYHENLRHVIVEDERAADTRRPLRRTAQGEKIISPEIADRISISRGGVKAHLAIAFDRLGASSRTEAASLAVSLGII